MKNWTAKLKAAMKHPAAHAFVARMNAEEEVFRQTLSTMKKEGLLVVGELVTINEHNGMPIRASKTWRLAEDRRAKKVFTEQCRRPYVEWTTDVRVSKAQAEVIPLLIQADWTVWCGVRRRDTGATALVMRMDTLWAIVYEDGTYIRGRVPVFQKKWPMTMKLPKDFVPMAKPLKKNAAGGFSVKRYADKAATPVPKMVNLFKATNEQVQICAKHAGLDECGRGAAEAVMAETLSERQREYLLAKLTSIGYVKVDVTDPGCIRPVK